MTILSDIVTQVEADVKAAITEGEKELGAFIAKVEQATETEFQKVEPVIVTDLSALTKQFGSLAGSLVVSLAGAAGAALTGTEKANLGVTTLIQNAAQNGVTILEGDASTLIKQAYTAWTDFVGQVKAPAAA